MKPRTAILAALIAAPTIACACETDADLNFLIGEWATGTQNELPSFVQRYEWGPEKSYIWAQTAFPSADGAEHVHFEGMIVWNAEKSAYDYLFVIEPGSGARETGVFERDKGGAVIRTVEYVDKNGEKSVFRQRFECGLDDILTTSLERKTKKGWVPTFGGSVGLIMARKSED